MSKKKTRHAYELELRKMIKARTGAECEAWLMPEVKQAAATAVVIDKVFDEIMETNSLVASHTGSMGQQKMEVSPLMPYFDKLQRTQMLHYTALGLTYNATPKKITENTRQGGEEHDKLAALLNDINDM